MYQVVLKKNAQKHLKKLNTRFKPKVIYLLLQLRFNPYLGKPLLGVLKGYYSLRVWPYRILYTINNKELLIIVIDIDHRQNIYQN